MVELIDDDNSITLDELKREIRRRQPSVIFDGEGDGEDLLRVIKAQYDRLDTVLEDVYDQHLVETATGEHLERLGLKYDIERKTGEADDKLRKRIQAARVVGNSRGTYQDIAKLATVLFEAEYHQVSLVRVKETADIATGEVRVAQDRFDNSPFTKSEISDLMSDAAIGGHRITVAESNIFRFNVSGNGFGSNWGQSIE